MGPLLLLWILSACSSDPDAPFRTKSSNIDSWSDPQNVYRYLKTSSGECLYQNADCSSLQDVSVTQFKAVSGFNGMPFGLGQISQLDINADGTLDDVSKYSGNLSTYTAKHSPSAVKKGLFTYFTYSGEVALDGFESGNSKIGTTAAVGCVRADASQLFKNSEGTAPALGIYVSRYNHVTGRVAKPVLVHMKCTNDPHENAAINVDASGYVYVFVSGRGEVRGNFVFRSSSADSIDGFIDFTPPMDNYIEHFNDLAETVGRGRPFIGEAYRGINYPKMYWVDEPNDPSLGYFRLIYTIYCRMQEYETCNNSRQLYSARMHVDGSKASIQDIKPLAAYKGHYAVANGRDRDMVVAFNVHPNNELDNRTNIYYMHSVDGGETWLNALNQELVLPITRPTDLDHVAVREYYDPGTTGPIVERIYMKDVNFAGTGLNKRPTVLYVGSVSVDHLPSKTVDHFLANARWTGESWVQSRLTNAVDHNYSSGSLFLENGKYRVFYPHTDEAKNNALAGGAIAFLDTGATDDVTGLPTLITEDVLDPMNGSSTYLADLCEFNYMKSVVNGSPDFVGLLSGGNVYQYSKTAPLFITDLYGSVQRLPTSFSDSDVINGEVALKPVVNCLDSAP
jgi:hypothetical protein